MLHLTLLSLFLYSVENYKKIIFILKCNIYLHLYLFLSHRFQNTEAVCSSLLPVTFLAYLLMLTWRNQGFLLTMYGLLKQNTYKRIVTLIFKTAQQEKNLDSEWKIQGLSKPWNCNIKKYSTAKIQCWWEKHNQITDLYCFL